MESQSFDYPHQFTFSNRLDESPQEYFPPPNHFKASPKEKSPTSTPYSELKWQSSIPETQSPTSPQSRRRRQLRKRPVRHFDADGHRGPLLKSILFPVTAIILPISLVSAVLIGLICGYSVKTDQSIFQPDVNANELSNTFYILVQYSATRLVFLASWLSTIAPILAAFVMALWGFPVAQNMRQASVDGEFDHLPTPYQLSLVIGLTLASMERLRRYFHYLVSKSRPTIPPVLNRAAMMLTACLLLSGSVFVADTALHYYTQTIQFDQISTTTSNADEFGHGLSEHCLNWNRSDWFCLPCAKALWKQNDTAGELAAIALENEVFSLQTNTSTKSEIRIIADESLTRGDLAVMMPQVDTVPAGVDYLSSSIGLSTQCRPITTTCNMSHIGYKGYDTQFNCSSGFWGVIGRPPVLSDAGDSLNQSADPNVPSLNWKPFLNLQYGFYTDADLTTPYSTGTYNSQGQFNDTGICTPDAALINPVYMGFAGRFSSSDLASGSALATDPGLLPGIDLYYDFVLSCAYTTYHVNYTWANGAVCDHVVALSPNGSLVEMYHGSETYTSQDGGAHDLVEDIRQAALQNTSAAFAREFANLHSVRALARIGAYTSPRTNLQEQVRTQLLVAKVPKIALAVLLGCSLAYTLLGGALGLVAWHARRPNVQDLRARLSVAGVAAAAFEERDGSGRYERISNDPDTVFSRAEVRRDVCRVAVEGGSGEGYILNPMQDPGVGEGARSRREAFGPLGNADVGIAV